MSQVNNCKNCIVHTGYDAEYGEWCCQCYAGMVTLCHEHTTENPIECYCLECEKYGRNYYAPIAEEKLKQEQIVGYVYLTQNQILGE